MDMAIDRTQLHGVLLFALLIPVCAIGIQEQSTASVRSTKATDDFFLVPTFSLSFRDSVSLKIMSTPTLRATSVITPTPTPSPAVFMETQMSSIVAANLTDRFISGTLNCVCDLLVDRCDTSCCCDQDCTSSELKVFDCTTSELSAGVCLDVNSVLWTSLSQCSCEDESLLCIIREQDPSMFEYVGHSVIEDSNQFISELLLYSVPGDTFAYQSQNSTTFTSFYKIEDPVLIVQNETSLGFLTIPSQFNGLHCHDGNPITYLRDEVRKCERQLTPLSVVCSSLSAVHINEDIAIAKVPVSVGGLQKNMSGVIPEISIKCSIAGELTPCSIAVPTYDNNTCDNALLEAVYTIIHNGTGQILGVYIDIVLGTVEGSQSSYIQKYTVKFQHSLEDKPTSTQPIFQRSGNPGYVVGQAVLAGSLSVTSDIIDISVDSNAWLSVRESGHQCKPDCPTAVVRFCEDLITTCVFEVSLTELLSDCESSKSRAIEILTPSPQLNYVGIFGDSNPLNMSEWIQLINYTAPRNVNDQTEQAGTLCNDFPTFLQVDILYSFIGHRSNPQAVISGVQFTYHTENIYKKIKPDTVMIPLRTAVAFTDVSAPPVQVLERVSNTIGHLPQDFLYPLFVSQAVVSYTISLTRVLVYVVTFMILL